MDVPQHSRRRVLKRVGAAGVTAALGGLASGTGAATDAPTSEEVHIPVALAPGAPRTYEIAGTLSVPPAATRKSTVQVLIHGITYARYYNDFPYQPERYSYRQHANAAGYPTLNIDRIGIGESSHPPAELVTLHSNAHVVHQVAEALRAGEIAGESFEEVMYVGHSYGSATALQAQATYGDADALVLTGFTATGGRGEVLTTPARTAWIPASLSDREDLDHLPPGYLTTMPGFRSGFYYTPNADPRVIEIDERNKQTLTATEAATFAGQMLGASRTIEVPVLEVNGDQDAIFCGVRPCSAPLEEGTTEPLHWPKAEFTLELIPGSGHDVFLQRNAPAAFRTILQWADERPAGGGGDAHGLLGRLGLA